MRHVTLEIPEFPAFGRLGGKCEIREVGLDQELRTILPGWRECNTRFHDHTIFCEPDWLLEKFKNNRQDVRVFLAERETQTIGAVPFSVGREPLICQLGDLVVAKIPVRVMRLLGYTPNIPADEPAYDLLFNQILACEFDAIYMNYVKGDSFLWEYLHTSPLIKRSFSFYSQRGLMPHLVIRMAGSFDEYMQKFSSKTRKNRLREIKSLRDRGDMQFVRVTQPDQVDSFLDAATEISRKSWQFKRLGWGIAAWDTEHFRENLKLLAQRGWLRSYLLSCRGEYCAFIVGQQYRQRFYHAAIGHDSAWSEFSVGTVLQMLVLEDLYTHNTPEIYDFGTYATYKEYFSNESYPEAIVWLFRKRPFPLLAEGAFRACCATSINAGALLDRFNLKSKVKRLLRRGRHARATSSC